MKTWEMMKMATENPERLFVNENGLEFGGGNNDRLHTMHLDYLQNGEWTEIKKPVGFMEAVASGKRIRVEHEFTNSNKDFKKPLWIDDFLHKLEFSHSIGGITAILINGEFYTED